MLQRVRTNKRLQVQQSTFDFRSKKNDSGCKESNEGHPLCNFVTRALRARSSGDFVQSRDTGLPEQERGIDQKQRPAATSTTNRVICPLMVGKHVGDSQTCFSKFLRRTPSLLFTTTTLDFIGNLVTPTNLMEALLWLYNVNYTVKAETLLTISFVKSRSGDK